MFFKVFIFEKWGEIAGNEQNFFESHSLCGDKKFCEIDEEDCSFLRNKLKLF